MSNQYLTTSYVNVHEDADCAEWETGPGDVGDKADTTTGAGTPASPDQVAKYNDLTSTESLEEPLRESNDYSDVPIEKLAMRGFIDTLPVEVEDYYGKKDVKILIDMLSDPEIERHHSDIVTLIGFISDGSSKDLDALEEHFMGSDDDWWQQRATGIALGYIASRTGSTRPVNFMINFLEDDKKAKSVIAGLGLSGNTEARSKLSTRETKKKEIGDDSSLESQAIEDNLRVKDKGLREYYGVKEKKEKTNT